MDCGMCATSIITRRRGAWWLDGREAIQRREGHLRPSASGGPTGSAAARLSGGRLAPQGRFTPQEAESSGETFRPWGAARLQRSSRWRRIPAPLPKRIVVCGISLRATMRQGVDQPCRIRGSWGCGPAPGGGTGGWRRKTLEGGLARGLPHDAAAVSALAWVIVKPAPEAGDGGGGGGGGGGLHRVGWGGSAGGWLADRWKANGELG